MTQTIGRAAFAALLALVIAIPLSAQGVQTGTVRGVVVDAQNLPVPGVTVTATSASLQGQRTAVTEMDGSYVIRLLPAGSYRLRFELSSFETVQRDVPVPLGGAVEQDVTLRAAGVAQQVDVTATVAPLATPTVGLNIRQEEVEALATSRTLQGIATLAPALNENTPNTRQLTINGAFAFDNVFMVDGVDVNDNLFGNPQNLFIEDAIEETQVLTSGISAEYGRFSGGVVNAITRSGGNTFSGSFRINLTNPSWTNETPFERENEIERQSTVNDVYEGTLGGPIIRDRLWFFGAGRQASLSNTETLDISGLAYDNQDKNWRAELKLTGSVRPNHTLQFGYLNNSREILNEPSFDFSIDPRTITNPTYPNWYSFGNYRGVLRNNLLAEAQYSERRFKFEGTGGTSTSIADSPFITLTQDLGHYNGPYFDATDPESRNNRQFTGSATYFAQGGGRHELKGGYEWYRSQQTGGNSQSATGYVFDADFLDDASGNPVLDSQGRFIPVFTPGATLIENWIATRGAELNIDNHSLYAQDHWTINRHLSADIGVRFERVRSEATGGLVGVDTDTVVPRLALSYDVIGDGRAVLSTTYGHYSGRYNESQVGENTNVGNPDIVLGRYTGPAGQGLDFAPGLNPANYVSVLGQFPTLNVFFEDGLSSPITREFTVSGGYSAGRAYGEATYVWRDQSNFIEDFIDSTNGTTQIVRDGINYGTFTNVFYRNSDEPKRRYQAAILQGRMNLTSNWTGHAAWTIQLKNEGNYEGEATNQPGNTSTFGDYPEILTEDRNFPIGRLATFQRHRARLWTIYNLDLSRLGSMSFSGLWRIESGASYSLAATGVSLTSIQEDMLEAAGYVDDPGEQTLYFGERGSETFPAHGQFDFSLNYNIPVFRTLRPWLKFDVFNLLDNDKLISFDTTVLPDPASPLDSLGRPTGYIRDDTFGQATGSGDYPASLGEAGGRAFRVAFGVRF